MMKKLMNINGANIILFKQLIQINLICFVLFVPIFDVVCVLCSWNVCNANKDNLNQL